jgi:excisionase family DNA binding protein
MSQIVLYTASEVAELLRLNHQVVQRKLQAGDIPGYRIGRDWRVEQSQLMDWLEKHSAGATQEGWPSEPAGPL